MENTHILSPPVSPSKISESQKYFWLISYALFLIFCGFLVNSPSRILSGIFRIMTSSGNLFTDYIQIGSLGSALVNSGLLTLLNTLLAKKLKIKLSSPLTAALYTMCGFSFFGKNLFNSLPILLGVYLYSKWTKTPFSRHILLALFGTALAPAVSFVTFGLKLALVFSFPLGLLTGLIIGFILGPLAGHFVSFHQGFNLYNIGFTAGIIGMLVTAILRITGHQVENVHYLSSGHNLFLATILYFSFFILAIIGFISNHYSCQGLAKIWQSSGKLISDFQQIGGYGPTLINMASLGIFATTYVLLIGGSLNGPVLGGIYTVVGFGAYGKHLKNCIPVMLGVLFLCLLKGLNPADTSIILTTLFGTTLAPICGYYGAFWGLLAGALHLSLVSNVGWLHGGLNLYNNGLSGGFIAALMVPLLDTLHQVKKEQHDEQRKKKG